MTGSVVGECDIAKSLTHLAMFSRRFQHMSQTFVKMTLALLTIEHASAHTI